MSQQHYADSPRKRLLPLVDDSTDLNQPPGVAEVDIDAELKAHEESERARLGMMESRRQWVDEMTNSNMTKKERSYVTLLTGGLTQATDFLAEGAIRSVGYNVEILPPVDNDSLQAGKEYGNRGQCNPTYYTVGNLIKELQRKRDEEGMSAKHIVDNYVFLTPGACGPCRFGMYVTEYRKALRDAGFDGFRVMEFQQQGGLSQGEDGDDVGLELNPEFFIAIIKAIVVGDVLNAIGYRIRPYEVVEGATDEALEEAKRICYAALWKKTNILVALNKSRKILAKVKVDKLRPKAKTSIIGEFWAMTTEGDGNYFLQRFLESEGAECDIQLTTAWLLYNIWEVARDTDERDDLREADGSGAGLNDFQGEFDVAKRQAMLRAADRALRVGFQTFANPAGLYGYKMPDMYKVAEVASEYYNNDLRGGEGHMEVGKLILNVVHNKANMTVSVKPFGCMPSSGVSDGVQSLITSLYPGSIFCAVETSGDGATNFYSRVQMYLYKARINAEQELAEAFEKTGTTKEEVQKFLDENPKYGNALHHSPKVVPCSAANLVYEVAPLMKMSRLERRLHAAKKVASSVAGAASKVPGQVAAAAKTITDPDVIEGAKFDLQLVADLLGGKAKERFAPLAKKLAARGYYENNSDFAQNKAGVPGIDAVLAAE